MNLAIIGCGNIGFRHFQSLISHNSSNHNIYLVDISNHALNACEEHFKNNPNLSKLKCSNSISDIKANIDIAIISTNSFVRRQVIESLYVHSNPKHLILEKFLFPKEIDYSFFLEFFKTKSTNVWVNQWVSGEFQELNNLLKINKKINLRVYGYNWGLCTNSVHFIDWFHLLTNRESLVVSSTKFDNNVLKGKREGCYELFGDIHINSHSGHELKISCEHDAKKQDRKIYLDIESEDNKISGELTERTLNCQFIKPKNKITKDYLVRYQSERTADIVSELIKNESCDLTEFKFSCYHHLLIYNEFKKIFLLNDINILEGIPVT